MLTQKRASYLLKPDFDIGILVWLANEQRPDLIGYEAGWLNEGYCRLAIDGDTYYRAQIIWLLYYGYIPDQTLDHKNLDRANDSINNLRPATKGQNAINAKMNIRNKIGFKGVSFCNSTGRYRADICINSQRVNLGRFDSPEEAHRAWVNAASVAFGSEFVRAA